MFNASLSVDFFTIFRSRPQVLFKITDLKAFPKKKKKHLRLATCNLIEKRGSDTGVPMENLSNFMEQFYCRTPSGDYFCSILHLIYFRGICLCIALNLSFLPLIKPTLSDTKLYFHKGLEKLWTVFALKRTISAEFGRFAEFQKFMVAHLVAVK